MNLVDTLKKLLRRWYILLVGLLLAGGAAFGVWTKVPPRYERSSTQVLLPGKASLPQDGQNPYLYIGGLTLAADVVVRAVGSENVVKEFGEAYSGIDIVVSRDPTTAGPVILITVSATNDDEAAAVLRQLAERTAKVLNELQQNESIPAAERMTVVTVTMDERGILRDRTRLVLSIAAGAGVLALAVLVAAIVEGLVTRRRRLREEKAADLRDGVEPNDERDTTVAEATTAAEDSAAGDSPDLASAEVESEPPSLEGEIADPSDAAYEEPQAGVGDPEMTADTPESSGQPAASVLLDSEALQPDQTPASEVHEAAQASAVSGESSIDGASAEPVESSQFQSADEGPETTPQVDVSNGASLAGTGTSASVIKGSSAT